MSNDESNITKLQGCNISTGCQTVTAVKSVNPDIAKIGDTVKYTITIKNDMSYPIEDIVVKDTLPSGLKLNTASIKVDGIGAIGDLESGIQINQIASKNKSIITFEVTIISADVNPKINVAEVNYTTIVGRVSIVGGTTTNPTVLNVVGTKITKTINPNIAVVGDILTINIAVTALVESTQNIITDELPDELELVDDKIVVNGVTIVGDITQGIDIGPIGKGQTKTVTFKAKVK